MATCFTVPMMIQACSDAIAVKNASASWDVLAGDDEPPFLPPGIAVVVGGKHGPLRDFMWLSVSVRAR